MNDSSSTLCNATDLSELSECQIVSESGDGSVRPSGIGLGIDAGGTYTDTVIYDLGERKVLAKAKSLTTYHNLVEGIRSAISQLPQSMLSTVQVTSLSTTLATNSIVEGRGRKVGLIALTPWGWTEEQIGHSPLINVPGSVGINGEIIEPLDEDSCRIAVKQLIEIDHCEAIVVAGYANVRNPSQCNRVREIIREMYDLPVVCSHEISRRLNARHAAQTSIANARLLPIIQDLIAAVHQALADFSIQGKLMVVKGDGTPVDESVARLRPVETILSGPAASVSGARALTAVDDALVLDIGGTTTDCAIIENGRVAVSEDGARVGSWVMSIDAAEISTAGLGGDSRIDFTRDGKITVGPVRCIPFAYLAYKHESVRQYLMDFDDKSLNGYPDASALDFLVLAGNDFNDLTARESALVDLLKTEGAVSVLKAAKDLDVPSHTMLSTSRLEACGMIKRCALTPTDLLHVSGKLALWDTDASKRALEIFAAIFGKSAKEVLEMAQTAVTRRIFEEIVRRELSWEEPKLHDLPEDWAFLLNKAFSDDGVGLGINVSLRRPIVAIGAPAQALVPAVSEHLKADILIPEHADVANAIGAIASEVTVREEVIIRPGPESSYVLHGAEERLTFKDLASATSKAIELCRERAKNQAIAAGAISPKITVTRNDRLGSLADGAKIFLERVVTAVALGGVFGIGSE